MWGAVICFSFLAGRGLLLLHEGWLCGRHCHLPADMFWDPQSQGPYHIETPGGGLDCTFLLTPLRTGLMSGRWSKHASQGHQPGKGLNQASIPCVLSSFGLHAHFHWPVCTRLKQLIIHAHTGTHIQGNTYEGCSWDPSMTVRTKFLLSAWLHCSVAERMSCLSYFLMGP